MNNIEVDFIGIEDEINEECENNEETENTLGYDVTKNGYLDEVLFKKSYRILRELVQNAMREIEKIERALTSSIARYDNLSAIYNNFNIMGKDDIRKIEEWLYHVEDDLSKGENLITKYDPGLQIVLGIKSTLYDKIVNPDYKELKLESLNEFTTKIREDS